METKNVTNMETAVELVVANISRDEFKSKQVENIDFSDFTQVTNYANAVTDFCRRVLRRAIDEESPSDKLQKMSTAQAAEYFKEKYPMVYSGSVLLGVGPKDKDEVIEKARQGMNEFTYDAVKEMTNLIANEILRRMGER